MIENQNIELLAPAGSFESLYAAVQSGADAIYIGGQLFSARASAANFSNEDIEEAVKYCKLNDVKLYVTVNTLIKDEELKALSEFLSFLHAVGVDGVIVQDLGVWFLLEDLVGLERHVSTQMTLHNTPAVEVLQKAGADQIVLSRELNLAEIASIKERTGAKLEVFGHGALCYSYSGQCLMSSIIGGRSGNRGRCAQPCRLNYTLVDNKGNSFSSDGPYLLSTKDLSTALDLEELFGIVDSLKLEGRLKKPEYVATVTRTYRELIDKLVLKEKADKSLREVFNRDFTKGYLFNKKGKEIMGHKRPSMRGLYLGKVQKTTGDSITLKLEEPLQKGDGIEVWVNTTSRDKSLGTVVGEIKVDGVKLDKANKGDTATIPLRGKVTINAKVYKTRNKEADLLAQETFKSERTKRKRPLDFFVQAKVGSEFIIRIQDRLGNGALKNSGYLCEKATKRPLTKEVLYDQLNRLGNTPYSICRLEVDLDDGVMVPFSVINEARRVALESLEKNIIERAKRKPIPIHLPKPKVVDKLQNTELIVEVSSFQLFKKAILGRPDKIYFHGESYQSQGFTIAELKEALKIARDDFGILCYYVFPRVLHDSELKRQALIVDSINFDGFVVGNLGAFSLLKEGSKVIIDWGLNTTNYVVAEFFQRYFKHLQIERYTASLELQNTELEALGKMIPLEVVVHGNIPLMVSKNCIIGTVRGHGDCQGCNGYCRQGYYYLKDRLGYVFPLLSDTYGRSHIFNSRDLCLLDEVDKLKSYASIRLLFTLSDEPVNEVIEGYRKVLSGGLLEGVKKELESISPRPFTYGHYFRGVE